MKFLGLSALASVALAIPMQSQLEARGTSGQTCDNPGRVVSIVLDSSGSTATSDPDRLRVQGGLQLVDYLTSQSEATATNKADTVSVVSFTTTADIQYPQGDPNEAARKSFDKVKSVAGTDIATGLAAGLKQVTASSPGDRGGLIIFTDGIDGSTDKIVAQINKAKEANIRVSWGHTNTGGKGKSSAGLIVDIVNGIAAGINALAGGAKGLDDRISAAVLATGGTVSIISTVEAQREFVQQVIKNGLTNNDGKCSGNDKGQSGGPLLNDVTTLGLCSENAEAVFTYSPKSQREKLSFAVSLISKQSPVNIEAVFTNKATGQTTTTTVNKGQAAGTLNGEANPGEECTVVIKTSGADSNECQYSVTLEAKAEGPAQPPVSSSATPSTPPPSPPSTSVPPPASSACPTPDAPQTVTSTVVQTVTAPAPAETGKVCICKCDAPGAKPMPKFEL